MARSLKHGGDRRGSRLPEYTVWALMRRRCTNESAWEYPRYGGRGIAVCERWSSFENFLADMGSRPTTDHQIDRIDNDGPYSPDNCRWATRIEQCNNRSYQRILEFDGRSMTLAQWSREVKINRAVLTARLNQLRWSVDRALTTPVRKSTRRRPPAEAATSSD